jgi:basic amino acid/polyamine antiporter, APA family
MSQTRSLRRILGLGFGIAFAFGTMVGVGILRLPGMVAAAAGTQTLILVLWGLGGLYALMGAVSISELATMYPEAGGFRIYARRAFGERAGFIVGWIDWLASVATLAYAAVSAIDFVGTLEPTIVAYQNIAAIAVIGAFTAMHAAGLRVGSTITTVVSTTVGAMLLLLVIACLFTPARHAAGIVTAAPVHLWSAAGLLALVPAMRALLTSYDGWYVPIYTAEESVDASRVLPRAIIGGAVLVTTLYLALNIALLHVLSVPQLAASKLPVASAAQIVLPHGSATVITWLSVLIVLGLCNGNVITGSRVLFSIARDGWISPKAAAVNRGGTPYIAVLLTALTSSAMILSGTFDQLIAVFTVLILLYYVTAFLAVFVLRRRLPQAARPYRAFGYPISTFIVLAGSVAFLVAAVTEDLRSAAMALLFLSLCIPAYAFAARARRARLPELAIDPG